MKKCALILSALVAVLLSLSAQCPVTLNCPFDAPQIGDATNNDPALWNDSYWWDAVAVNHDLPDATVDLSVTATDQCSNGNFTFHYLLFLDLDGDGAQETVVSSDNLPPQGTVNFNNINTPNYAGGTPRVFDQRSIPAVFKYRFSMQTLVKAGQVGIARLRWQGAGFDNYVLPQLPYGTHRIQWTVTNSAGNQAECAYTFTVKDCGAPSVFCLNGLSINILPTGMSTLWAIDLIQYANDNYIPAGQLQYAISRADVASFPADNLGNPVAHITLNCDDLGPVPLKLWVKDAAGNINSCETTLSVNDDQSNCAMPGNVRICVESVCDDGGAGIEDADFTATGTPPPGLPPITVIDMSDQQGCTGIKNMIPPEYIDSYAITPSKNDNPANGVSAYDLALISWHIDGTQPFTEPWQWIAADADNNGVIDSFDIIELWKLNLGIYAELPDNASWRFYPSNYDFPPGNPLAQPVPNALTVAEILANPDLKFYGVKIGDVDCSAIANGFGQNPSERAVRAPGRTVISPPQPNPATADVRIPVQLAEPGNIRIEMRDLSGKLLWFNDLQAESGAQSLGIPATAFPSAGIYVWRVQTGPTARSGKIVRQ